MTEFPDGYVHDLSQESINELRAAIPSHLLPGLDRYVRDRIPVGHFLTAILRNDLCGAYQRANDEHTRAAIWDIVQYLNGCFPASAWGSRDGVAAWLAARTYDHGVPEGIRRGIRGIREGDEGQHSGE